MDVLEFNDEGYFCAGLAGIKDTTMTVARIFAFVLKCDEDVEMRENMFVLCRTCLFCVEQVEFNQWLDKDGCLVWKHSGNLNLLCLNDIKIVKGKFILKGW